MRGADDEFMRRRLEQLQQETIDGGGDPPHVPPMSLYERVARVEEAIGGLRHSQNLVVALGAIVVAIIVGFGLYTLQRIDNVHDRVVSEAERTRDEVNGVSSQIGMQATETRRELTNLVTAISNSITAARQPAPKQ